MRRPSVWSLALIVMLGVPAMAGDFALRGQWEARMPANPGYKGVMLIDADGRVTFDSPNDQGRPAKFIGYVRRIDERQAQIIATNRTDVAKAYCFVESSEMLHCYAIRADKSSSVGFMFVKVGPGPTALTKPAP